MSLDIKYLWDISATLYATIFTVSNGILKTPGNNYNLLEIIKFTALTNVGAVFCRNAVQFVKN